MKKILVTGGTTFVSKYTAEYFVNRNYEVYVLNRNSKPQICGVKLIEGDRHHLGEVLKDIHFDVVADITAYTANDISDLYVISDEADEAYNYAEWKYPNETSLVLHRFCVSPGFQNRGIGKKVLMKIESQIKNKGYDSIRLDVFTKNPYAQRLYRNHGYEVCGFAEWRERTF